MANERVDYSKRENQLTEEVYWGFGKQKLFKFEADYCIYWLYTEAAPPNYLVSMQP